MPGHDPDEALWPLGTPPRIGRPLPDAMHALTIRRDQYGPPAEAVRVETAPAPRLGPVDAKRVLVAILATGPNFNTNFAALGLPVPVFGRGDAAAVHIPGSDALGIVVDAGPAVSGVKTGQAEQAATKLDRINDEIETFKNSFREKLLSEFSSNMQGRNTLEAEVSSLRFKQEKRFIIAPVNGYVHQLPVKTVGGVVTTAQPVVSLVPENTPLLVNALVFNKDIGFVKEGQRCVIKVDTYDFQKYGTIEGMVQTIFPFSLEEKEKEKEKGNEAGGYPVHVKMLSEILKTKDETVYKIKPGMSVAAEINVGKRRVIEFFLFPVIRYLDEGLKVR